MILHGFAESGPCYKVALMLELTGIRWQARKVEAFSGETRSPAFRALNPMGEVPVLEDEGLMLAQSGAILCHLAERTGQFGGANHDVLPWLLWDTEKLTGLIGPLRFAMNFMPDNQRDPAVIAWLAKRLRASLKTLDARLAAQDWLAGDAPSIADIAAAGYLFHPEPFSFDADDWPAILAWLDRIRALPGWKHPYDILPRLIQPAA